MAREMKTVIDIFEKFLNQSGRLISILRIWYKEDFMKLTPRRMLLCAFFVGFFSWGSNNIAIRYYASDDMPPPFRNMDMAAAWENMKLYMEAQELSSESMLVVGDCVGYGNGSAKAFPHYMSIPGKRVVNLSMHSFNYDLMLKTIDYAHSKGVRDIMVQLHPFQNYRKDASEFKTSLVESVDLKDLTVADISAKDLALMASNEWKEIGVAMDSKQKRFSFHKSVDKSAMLKYSTWMRYDLLSHFPLFRNRYVLDDALNLRFSFYSIMSYRRDTFTEPLPESRQREIFLNPDLAFLWKLFSIPDRKEYRQQMIDYSPVARIGKYAQENNINLTFLMVPTVVDKIAQYTIITKDDLKYTTSVFREIAEMYGMRYLDYLDDQRFIPYLYHYDNLTNAGQKLLGKYITEDLARDKQLKIGAMENKS